MLNKKYFIPLQTKNLKTSFSRKEKTWMENEINYQPEENLNKVEQTTEITNESEEIISRENEANN